MVGIHRDYPAFHLYAFCDACIANDNSTVFSLPSLAKPNLFMDLTAANRDGDETGKIMQMHVPSNLCWKWNKELSIPPLNPDAQIAWHSTTTMANKNSESTTKCISYTLNFYWQSQLVGGIWREGVLRCKLCNFVVERISRISISTCAASAVCRFLTWVVLMKSFEKDEGRREKDFFNNLRS